MAVVLAANQCADQLNLSHSIKGYNSINFGSLAETGGRESARLKYARPALHQKCPPPTPDTLPDQIDLLCNMDFSGVEIFFLVSFN